MNQKAAFSYRTVQRIKTEEFEHFFADLEEYDVYVNHLGEVRWMTEAEAEDQHEFFIHIEGPVARFKRRLHSRNYPNLNAVSEEERELRLQFRKYLEETYLGSLRPETAAILPTHWQHPLSKEDIESIPITLDTLETVGWNKKYTLLLVVFLIIAVSLIYYFVAMGNNQPTGGVVITTNVKSATIFLDTKKQGFVDSVRTLSNIPVGTHRLSIRKPGYSVQPEYYDFEVYPDSLVRLNFVLLPKPTRQMGYVRISADYPDSKIFIDRNYFGVVEDIPVIPLNEGTYRISVKKSGFISTPPEEVVTIYPGDTTLLIFQQVRTSATRGKSEGGRARVQLGTLEVTANITGARIFLNDEDTGKDTDYVFTNLAPGVYRVKLVREGYRSVPEEQRITISPENTTGEAAFELIKEYEQVRITTNPLQGEIYIDGELQGKGSFSGQLKIGEHNISFGKIEGYKTPRSRRITVRANSPVQLDVKYFPQMQILAEVTGNGNVHTEKCEVLTGYTFSNRGFTPSDEAGPEIVYHEALSDYFWKLGFAFPFRNPKGNDAIKVKFTLPQDLGYEQKFTVKISAAASKENYPLTLSAKVDIRIRFNGKILSYYYKPELLEEINGMEEVEWDISTYLKPGVNSLEISTTDKNNTFYYLKRILIYN